MVIFNEKYFRRVRVNASTRAFVTTLKRSSSQSVTSSDRDHLDQRVYICPLMADTETIAIPIEDLSPIAQPLAQKKLLKKIHKVVKKGMILFIVCLPECSTLYFIPASRARQVKRGVKEVVKGIRKGEKG